MKSYYISFVSLSLTIAICSSSFIFCAQILDIDFLFSKFRFLLLTHSYFYVIIYLYQLFIKHILGILQAFPEHFFYPIVLRFPFYELKKGATDYGSKRFMAK